MICAIQANHPYLSLYFVCLYSHVLWFSRTILIILSGRAFSSEQFQLKLRITLRCLPLFVTNTFIKTFVFQDSSTVNYDAKS